jgi:hypothetical protein
MATYDDDPDEEGEEIAEDQIEEIEALRQVAQSEHDIIMMARALVAGPDSTDDIWSLLCASRNVATKIGPTCEELLQSTLSLSWRALWQRGGTKPRVSHTGQRGRLFERYQPTDLKFSSQTLVFLRWLVTTPFSAPASTLKGLPAAKLELGDQLMIYFALDAARATPALRVIAQQPFVQSAPLAWLGFAQYMTDGRVPAFDSLTTGAGPIIIEALSEEISRRWQAGEVAKRSMTDPAELIAIGAAQENTLTGFLDACDKRARRDLGAFVLDAIQPLIERNVMPVPGQLDPTAPLSVRANARSSAGALCRALMRWSNWDQQHRGIRYIDDDYAKAQVLLARFEKIGAAGVSRVQGWLMDLSSLAPTAN